MAVTNDRTFGPIVVCGLAGVLSELAGDVSFRLPPVSDLDAEEMVERLRLRPLLDGYGGGPAGDRPALVDLLRRVSALVEALPETEALELSVRLLPPGRGALVAEAKVHVRV